MVFAEGGDDGDLLVLEGVEDGGGVTLSDLSDLPDIDGFVVVVLAEELGDGEDVGAVDGGGLATEFGNDVDEVLIDLAVKGSVDDLDRFGGGDAESTDKFGFESSIGHGGGDGLTSTVDDDGFDAGDFEEDDVAHDFANKIWVVHGGATHFDEKGFSSEALEVREGFDEDGGFFGGGGHEEGGWVVCGKYRTAKTQRREVFLGLGGVFDGILGG